MRVERAKIRDRVCYLFYRQSCIGEINYVEYSNEEYEWNITLYKDIISEYQAKGELRLLELMFTPAELKNGYSSYKNAVPGLVSEKLIPPDREDIEEVLEFFNMGEYDCFELLCRGHGVGITNRLYVGRKPTDIFYGKDLWDYPAEKAPFS